MFTFEKVLLEAIEKERFVHSIVLEDQPTASVCIPVVNGLLDSLVPALAPILLEMSHAVVRGEPNAAQLYLDRVLDEILSAKGIQPNAMERDNVSLAEIMFHSLKKYPCDLYMINGATGEKITNEYILKLAVSIARSISVKCPVGRTVMLIMRNHQRMVATYWATLFSGVLPFMMDPNTTAYELSYFLNLIEPHHVFCDREHYKELVKTDKNLTYKPNVVICDEEDTLREFIESFSEDFENYQLPKSTPEASIMLLPTSGSTGFPKAAIMINRGLVGQLPCSWAYHSRFPKPTDMAMVLTTVQWMTFTMTVTSTALYHIPLLISPQKPSVEHVTEMLEKFRPTWTFFTPSFSKGLLATIEVNQLSSLKTIMLGGAPITPNLISAFKEKLPATTEIGAGYGTTETHGPIALPDRVAPITSNGRVINILHYKLLNDNGVEVKPGNNGELYVKGECVIKGYYRNNDSYNGSFQDGWYRTGDWMYLDHNKRLHFIERRKFSFKFKGNQVAPEEVEAVINTVPGVHESFVCATDKGPAAAVVLHSDCTVTREQIHDAVNSNLSDHKRLHGGLAIVKSLLHTHSGKLKREECKELIHYLIQEGECL